MPISDAARPLDVEVPDKPVVKPSLSVQEGEKVRLEPLTVEHTDDMWQATNGDEYDCLYDYMPRGPFKTKSALAEQMQFQADSTDPLFFAVIDKSDGKCVGQMSLMRHDPSNRVVEVGFILFSPKLQRTTLSTEAQFLLAKYVFDKLGYRRYEWKCHNLNEPSKKAAERLGFQLEGVFRNHMIVKGRNRDTAWFSIIDSDWPAVREAYLAYLSSRNFDSNGNQLQGLKQIRDRQSI